MPSFSICFGVNKVCFAIVEILIPFFVTIYKKKLDSSVPHLPVPSAAIK